ncbi:DNA polymerase IV [Thorsellia kenyensis]|uniref:DNA polymerase IV n=1 Tax=Thorsellia kenyensis TaxID=1549888 RepID=A0ABV6C822_9GAMM
MYKYIHIDMDCFFAAVEMRDNPKLATIPLAIGGQADRRGVICTANYEARKFGVRSAMSTAKALQLCPKLTVLPPRHSYYKEISSKINEIYKRYTSLIEPVSLDEAYLDVTDNTEFNGSATYIAQDIRRAIQKEIGLTASAGVAPLMFLAKIASDINKPNGIFTLAPTDVPAFIEQLELKKIPGVGKVTQKKLADLKLYTCADLKNVGKDKIITLLGKFGHTLLNYAEGKEARRVNTNRITKSISVETTFNINFHQIDQAKQKLDEQLVELEKRISENKKQQYIQKIQVKVKFDDFKQTTLEVSQISLSKSKIHELFDFIWVHRREQRGIRMIGVGVALKDENNLAKEQLSLFLD